MGKIAFTNTHDLISALGATMNLINPVVENHHEQVAYLSFLLACELGMDQKSHMLTVTAALMHDVGALFSDEQPGSLTFELSANTIAHLGADMMDDLPYFSDVAAIVRHCQRPWHASELLPNVREELPLASSIVHLADYVSLCLNDKIPVLNQRDRIVALVQGGRSTEHPPEVVDAFVSVAQRDSHWMDLLYHPHVLMRMIPQQPLSLEKTAELTRVMSRLIDYRSSFTAMHSAGVSASAVRLAQLVGMSEDECVMMAIAGNLHDLGKIRTPREILEKPGRLTNREFNIIKEHTYFTYTILSRIAGFERICEWAALHHEKLDGSGYPFHLAGKDLPLGSRIMAVADIFSAITEERPYRAGMDREQAIAVMRENVERGAISANIVQVLLDNYDDVNAHRDEASRAEGQRYFRALEKSNVA